MVAQKAILRLPKKACSDKEVLFWHSQTFQKSFGFTF